MGYYYSAIKESVVLAKCIELRVIVKWNKPDSETHELHLLSHVYKVWNPTWMSNSGSQILSRELQEWEVRKMDVGFGYLTLYENVYVSHWTPLICTFNMLVNKI